jgi:hypothetical protein
MVVLMTQDFAGGNREIAEAVANDMDVRENPPAGLMAHVLTDLRPLRSGRLGSPRQRSPRRDVMPRS